MPHFFSVRNTYMFGVNVILGCF